MEDRPFALIGVNSDRDRERLRRRCADEAITWRSFWDGPQGTDGPIARSWRVRSWPTYYVLDHDGVIRHKGHRIENAAEAVERLVAAVERAGRADDR